jgi:hypothetical protein
VRVTLWRRNLVLLWLSVHGLCAALCVLFGVFVSHICAVILSCSWAAGLLAPSELLLLLLDRLLSAGNSQHAYIANQVRQRCASQHLLRFCRSFQILGAAAAVRQWTRLSCSSSRLVGFC